MTLTAIKGRNTRRPYKGKVLAEVTVGQIFDYLISEGQLILLSQLQ